MLFRRIGPCQGWTWGPFSNVTYKTVLGTVLIHFGSMPCILQDVGLRQGASKGIRPIRSNSADAGGQFFQFVDGSNLTFVGRFSILAVAMQQMKDELCSTADKQPPTRLRAASTWQRKGCNRQFIHWNCSRLQAAIEVHDQVLESYQL